MSQISKLDSTAVDFVNTAAEMILQLRIDVRRDTYDWFNALFKDFKDWRAPKPKNLTSLKDIIKKPLYLIDFKNKQQSGNLPQKISLTIKFCLIQKQSAKSLCHEHWTIEFEPDQNTESEMDPLSSFISAFAHIHQSLMSLPMWSKFLNGDSAYRSRRRTHFINYEISVGKNISPFNMETVYSHQIIINKKNKLKSIVKFSQLQETLFGSQNLLKNGRSERFLSHISKKTLHKKQSAQQNDKSKYRSLNDLDLCYKQTRTTSQQFTRKISAIHFEDSESETELTFLQLQEKPKETQKEVQKVSINLEGNKSSSDFQTLKTEREEAFDIFIEQLAFLKSLIPSEETQHNNFFDIS